MLEFWFEQSGLKQRDAESSVETGNVEQSI